MTLSPRWEYNFTFLINLHVAYTEKDACIRVHFYIVGKYSGQFDISWNSKSTKKTNIVRESAKLRALGAHVLTCLACSSANVPSVLTCSRANVPCVLTYSRVLRTYVLTCLACLSAHVL